MAIEDVAYAVRDALVGRNSMHGYLPIADVRSYREQYENRKAVRARILAAGLPPSPPPEPLEPVEPVIPPPPPPVPAREPEPVISGQRKIRDVQRAVCRYFGVDFPDLVGHCRAKPLVHYRQVAMYVVRMVTGASLSQMGRAFGMRDHTTIFYGCDKVAQEMGTDVAVKAHVEGILAMFPPMSDE